LNKTHQNLLDYYLSGEHAFIACDDAGEMELILGEVRDGLIGRISTQLDCSGLSTFYDFSEALTCCTNEILEQLSVSTLSEIIRPGSSLQVLNEALSKRKSQGYLLIANFDEIVSTQDSFAVEASLREVMQFHSDLAVIIAGSRETIITIGQYDRPFYLSFRIFWL
jgi:hypothetical protein